MKIIDNISFYTRIAIEMDILFYYQNAVLNEIIIFETRNSTMN